MPNMDWDAFDNDEEYYKSLKWWEKIRRVYWRIIPHHLRPGELWYQLKCFLWNRYTTVRPQYLGHAWCDRSELLPHVMFQILTDFVIKENGGIDIVGTPLKTHVDWFATDHHTEAWNEMVRLYKWWHNVYIPFFNDGWKMISKSHDEYHALQDQIEGDLTKNMKKLVDIKDYLWT
jgi:hypothetical protein